MKRTFRVSVMALSIWLVVIAISNNGYLVFGSADSADLKFDYIKEEKHLEQQLATFRDRSALGQGDSQSAAAIASIDYVYMTLNQFETYAKAEWDLELQSIQGNGQGELTAEAHERLKLKVTTDLISAGNTLDAQVIEPFKQLAENPSVSPDLIRTLKQYYELRKNAMIHQYLNQ